MSVKYKIENAKLNKKLVGDTVTVSKIKKTNGDGGKGPRDTKQPTLRELIIGLQKDVKNIQQTLKRNNIV